MIQQLIVLVAIIVVSIVQHITALKINDVKEKHHRIRRTHLIEMTEKEKSRSLVAGTTQCNLDQVVESDIKILINLVGNPLLLDNGQASAIADVIQETYNSLSSCESPYSRRIDSVVLQTNLQDFQSFDEHFFSLEYSVRLECQGCKEDSSLLFYDMDDAESECPCLGPSAHLFEDSFSEQIELLLEGEDFACISEFRDGAEMKQLPQCLPYQEFDASVVVEFFGCPLDIDQSRLDSMAAAFSATYNQMNLRNAESCDVHFREITSIIPHFDTSSLTVDFNRRRHLLKREKQEAKDISRSYHKSYSRDLTEGYYHDDYWWDDGLVDDGLRHDDDYYHDDYYHDDDHETSDDDSSGFGCDPEYFEILFDIRARCRNCDTSTITLFDRFQDQNFFFGFDDDDYYSENEHERRATENNSDLRLDSRKLEVDDCSCPVDPVFRAITEEEMIDTYALMVNDLYIEDVIEVHRVQCNAEVDSFSSSVEISFASNSSSTEDINAIIENFQRSYNDLSQRFCDSSFRSVQQVAVSSQTITPAIRYRELGLSATVNTILQPNKFNFTFILKFTLFITGLCRGCKNSNTNLFDDASRRRLNAREMNEVSMQDNKYRRLESDDQCFCAASNFNLGAPTEREFTERYDTDIQILVDRGILASQYPILAFQEEEGGPSEDNVPVQAECSIDADCASNLAIARLCINHHCVNEGDPRITLTWEGDDDLDLSVVTPQGVRVGYDNDFDQLSGGSFDTGFVQDVEGSHVENIFFPVSGTAPKGDYTIAVDPYEEREGSDTWLLQVFEVGQSDPVLTETGTGYRSDIIYTRA
mmetsp:Transcript_12338/g.18955  ORF Transcript_12338/g.18955 Transcript_12338/m.18955 type:complete len:815 (+) Transcript_12338:100-2544(+)